MAGELNKLKLGKGSAFVKRDLRQLPQTNDVWETDFLPLSTKGPSHGWLGIVVNRKSKLALATRHCDIAPTVNDLASLLSNAMRRPVVEVENRQRPKKVLVRDNPHWTELIPHLEQLGIEVAITEELPLCKKEAAELSNRDTRRPIAGRKRPARAIDVEAQYPNVAKWVNGYGRIEIGDTDWLGFQVIAVDAGGLIYENTNCDSLAGAMQALEAGLEAWFKDRGR